MPEFTTNGAKETEDLGAELSQSWPAGTIVAITGELGAGKTQFVRGLVRGLGSPAKVHSPTFAIVNLYEGGRLPIAHLDLYRLETPEQLFSAGIEEFLNPEGIAAIEWAERLFTSGPNGEPPLISEAKLASHLVRVTIEVLDENSRRICYEDSGA